MENNSYHSRIEAALEKQNLTFKDLVDHVKMSENEIVEGLEQHLLQQRTIMAMAKFLQVPIYSFFYPQETPDAFPLKSFANLMAVWEEGEELSPNKLREEIEFLEKILGYKKEQLSKWKTGIS